MNNDVHPHFTGVIADGRIAQIENVSVALIRKSDGKCSIEVSPLEGVTEFMVHHSYFESELFVPNNDIKSSVQQSEFAGAPDYYCHDLPATDYFGAGAVLGFIVGWLVYFLAKKFGV